MALTSQDEVFVTVDGFIKSANLRNVAVRIMAADLADITGFEELIPHDDALSEQAFHMFPDISLSGSLVATTWQRCPIVDQQGNANECDIGVQFTRINNGQLQGGRGQPDREFGRSARYFQRLAGGLRRIRAGELSSHGQTPERAKRRIFLPSCSKTDKRSAPTSR